MVCGARAMARPSGVRGLRGRVAVNAAFQGPVNVPGAGLALPEIPQPGGAGAFFTTFSARQIMRISNSAEMASKTDVTGRDATTVKSPRASSIARRRFSSSIGPRTKPISTGRTTGREGYDQSDRLRRIILCRRGCGTKGKSYPGHSGVAQVHGFLPRCFKARNLCQILIPWRNRQATVPDKADD